MSEGKNIEIAVQKTLPKFLAILIIMEARAEQCGSIELVQAEMKKHVPEEIMKYVYDINSRIIEGIPLGQDDMAIAKHIDEMFGRYMEKLGPDSIEIAEAAADPTLKRVDKLANEIAQIFFRSMGINPLPVLKNKTPFYFMSPAGNLSDDEKLDRRIGDVEHILGREGKTLDDVSKMPLEDIIKIREQVQKRGKTIEPREFYEMRIAEKYGQHMMSLSQEITPEKTSAIPELGELSRLIEENIPNDIPSTERKALLSELQNGGLANLVALQQKMLALKAAQQFISCAIDMDYVYFVRELRRVGGVDVEIDGKAQHLSVLDYVELGKKDMAIIKKLKDYLVDIAMEKGLDNAITSETINEGIRFAYGWDKAAYVADKRLKLRIESAVAQSLAQGRKIPLDELTSSPAYKHITKMMDEQVEMSARQVFGEK